MFINTWDQARFGLLFLRNGSWSGKQIIPKEWIKEIQKPSQASTSYGYMWWLNKGPQKWEGVTEKVYYASGFGGNYIVVDEEHDLLIITRWLEPSKLGEMVKLTTSALMR
jgi:CubicO group peptidase (beta-lactamase class C family)